MNTPKTQTRIKGSILFSGFPELPRNVSYSLILSPESLFQLSGNSPESPESYRKVYFNSPALKPNDSNGYKVIPENRKVVWNLFFIQEKNNAQELC